MTPAPLPTSGAVFGLYPIEPPGPCPPGRGTGGGSIVLRPPLPTWRDWQDAAARLGLRSRAGELIGPCPSCGGTDRFHLRRAGAAALVGCRGCIDGGGDGFGRALRAAFPAREDAGVGAGTAPVSAPERPPPRPDPEPAPDPRIALAACLWRASVPADDTPGRVYLAQRWAWPPLGIGPDLPPSVRWLDAGAQPAPAPAAKWRGLPPGVAGALVFAWRSADEAAGGDLRAVSLEALDASGRRPDQARTGERWRRTIGRRSGTVFVARAAPERPLSALETLHVAEGEVSALGLSIAPWGGPGAVYAAGGTSGIRHAGARWPGPVVFHADGDKAGRNAALAASPRAEIEYYAEDEDPASCVTGWLLERAAIREFLGGAARDEATRGAWMDLFTTQTEGET